MVHVEISNVMKRKLFGYMFIAFIAAVPGSPVMSANDEVNDHEQSHDHAQTNTAKHEEEAGDAHVHASADQEVDHATGTVNLGAHEMEEFGIKTGLASSGVIQESLELPGEVALDPERLTHVVPRVPGITMGVYKFLGDSVNAGDLLAVLSSRELAELRAETEAAASRHQLAKATFDRESKLIKEGITSETEYLEARQALDASLIEYKLAQQKLKALGLDEASANKVCDPPCDQTRYEIQAPRDGTIIEKHIVQGELLDENSRPFVIADLEKVWVHMTIYPDVLHRIKPGQQARISAAPGQSQARGKIDYVNPILSTKTRTAIARIILANEERQWRPGQFVTVRVVIENYPVAVSVPVSALQEIDGRSVVFVREGQRFTAHEVITGRRDNDTVEILAGLAKNEEIVVKNAFTLKAELQKGDMPAGHAH